MADLVTCQVCGGATLHELLDMGQQPLAEQYRPVNPRVKFSPLRYPLVLQECANCSLVQLSPDSRADPHVIFPPSHPYSTGNSGDLRKHFAQLAKEIMSQQQLQAKDLVVDIGANDGTLLASFDPKFQRVGVEPTGQALKCADKGVTVYQEFFNHHTAASIVADFGNAKVVTATNVLAHVPDPHEFLLGVKILLAQDGVFVTENHHIESVLSGLQIDTIYHEHLRFYSVESLGCLLAKHGLTIFAAQDIPTHGGSFRVHARRKSSGMEFRNNAHLAAQSLASLLERIHTAGGNVYGIGATTRATPLIHFARISKYIDCIVEVKGSEKIGMMMPGTDISIFDEEKLFKDQPSHALLFSWHMADTIIPKLRERGYTGKIIIPLPSPRVIED